MVEFNLMPEKLKSGQKKRMGVKLKIPKLFPAPVIITVISILLVSQGLLAFFATVQSNRFLKLQAVFNEIAPQEKVAMVLKKEADELSSRLLMIDSLTSGSLIWSKKLYDLSGAVIDGVWLTSLDLKTTEISGKDAQKGGRKQALFLKGSAVSPTPGGETAIIGKFIESLRSHKGFFSDFDDIKVSTIQRKQLGEIEVMDFTIICYFKQERRYFEKLKA